MIPQPFNRMAADEEDPEAYKIAQYECFRSYFLGEPTEYRLCRDSMIFLSKGMLYWYQHPIKSVSEDSRDIPGNRGSSAFLDFQNELPLILTNLTIAATGGI